MNPELETEVVTELINARPDIDKRRIQIKPDGIHVIADRVTVRIYEEDMLEGHNRLALETVRHSGETVGHRSANINGKTADAMNMTPAQMIAWLIVDFVNPGTEGAALVNTDTEGAAR